MYNEAMSGHQPHVTKKKRKPRFLVLQVISKRSKKEGVATELSELRQLIHTFGGTVVKEIIQRRDHPDPSTYIGSGKVEELKNWCDAEEIDVVVINALAKSGQLFRVEKELWKVNTKIMVWDRIDLILNIFDQHAETTESKLQIKLARVTHMGPRIYGLGQTELSRQGGGVGTRGKGETNIEFERRQIKADRQKIKKDLKKILKQKHNRLRKRNELGIGPVALVGYTSAGKTTLFNTLTGKDKEMNRGLFTTLDTVVGKMKHPDHELPLLISDTIGFISNLPPVLIDSFKSTLLESLEADLLLHVVDVSDPHLFEKNEVVKEILANLKADQPTILVCNKVDRLTEDQLNEIKEKLAETELSEATTQIMYVSGETGQNIDELKEVISTFFTK
jgi:GTP-binding protein HflX